ncbi:MAG: hypothetical protein GY711_14715 [bacterium]|nr:hypothetical protein [bacterium]
MQHQSTPETPPLRARVLAVGSRLSETLGAVATSIDGSPEGPNRLARTLGVDKVFTSRLLKALKQTEPARVLHHVPGPMPLRRFLAASRKNGAPVADVETAMQAVDDFERLIQDEVGDRSALGAIISAWVPDARKEFELRRKQTAFKAISELKGYSTRLDLSTVFLHPSAGGTHIDVVWLIEVLGLRRLRPGARIKLSSRRIVGDDAERRPTALDGTPLAGNADGRLPEFCKEVADEFEACSVDDVVHYTLAGSRFGPSHEVDLVFAEVNEREMPRYVDPASSRRGYAYSDISIPAKASVFDVFVHEDIYPGQEPELILYDTVIDGVADINDPTRDIDRLDMCETVELLGRGLGRAQLTGAPRYVDLIENVYRTRGWNAEEYRGFRVRIDYPFYGSQVAIAFDPPAPPA